MKSTTQITCIHVPAEISRTKPSNMLHVPTETCGINTSSLKQISTTPVPAVTSETNVNSSTVMSPIMYLLLPGQMLFHICKSRPFMSLLKPVGQISQIFIQISSIHVHSEISVINVTSTIKVLAVNHSSISHQYYCLNHRVK